MPPSPDIEFEGFDYISLAYAANRNMSLQTSTMGSREVPDAVATDRNSSLHLERSAQGARPVLGVRQTREVKALGHFPRSRYAVQNAVTKFPSRRNFSILPCAVRSEVPDGRDSLRKREDEFLRCQIKEKSAPLLSSSGTGLRI